MKKIETVWHHILFAALEEKRYKHTQKELAEKFGYSLSTVNHSLKIPAQIGAIRKTARFFVLEDFRKLLYYWGSMRELKRDILYQTYVDGPVREIEGLALPESIYACYSAARKLLKEPPADYSAVYFYLNQQDLAQARQRFPRPRLRRVSTANLYFLKLPEAMGQYGKITTLPQTFVDIWNLADWYARDFVQALEEKMYGLLS